MEKELERFYSDLRKLMKKHGLTMECMDDYDGNGRWCGKAFTLRSKEPLGDRYPICVEDLNEFVKNGSD